MARRRISIAGLMAVVAACGLGSAVLASPTQLGLGLLDTSMALMLLAAVLGSLIRRGRARTFWTGVAVFGWGFYILRHGDWHWREEPWRPSGIDYVLMSILDVYSKFNNIDPLTGFANRNTALIYCTVEGLMNMFVAVFGGWLALHWSAREEPPGNE